VVEASTVTGPAKNLIRFARYARTSGPPKVDLSVATFYRGPDDATTRASNQFIEAVRSADIDLEILGERFRFDPAVLPKLAGAVRRRRPDILQTHSVKSHFLLRLSGLWREYPWLAFHHGYTAENLKMRAYNQLDRFSLRKARRMVTVCEPFAEELVKMAVPREKIAVLPNSIEPAIPPTPGEVEAARREHGISTDERVILSIGRFSTEKAQADLIAAAEIASRTAPQLRFRLVLVGDGVERANLVRAAAAAGLSDRTVFTGHRRDVRPYYALADIFVLPSWSEGSPNVLLEAMAFGVPIVATAVGGVPETVRDNESALLVPARNPSALAEAIGRALGEAALARRLSAGARSDAATRFSPKSYRETLTGIYRELTADSSDESAVRTA